MKTPLLTAALLALVASLPAQTSPCDSLNDANTLTSGSITSFGFAGPNYNAWQYTPSNALVPRAIRLYTGNTGLSGFMTLEVRNSDPATNLPGARVGGGTWLISAALGDTWQGADFDAIFVLQAGTPYWFVWSDPGFSTVPTEPGGVTLPWANSSNGTAWAAGTASALKFRLYCSLLDDQNVVTVGNPCATAGGALGSEFTNQAPTVGNPDFALEGTGFPGGALAFLAVGLNPNYVASPLPGFPSGCMQYTDVLNAAAGNAGTGNVRSASALGHVTFPLPIPTTPSLVGLFLGTQLAGLDIASAAPIPFVTSNGLQLTVY
jgi:hypothetical protein